MLGGIEAGGTKMVFAIANDKGEILDRRSIPTKIPEETLPEIVAYFQRNKVQSLGIGCFGPLNLNPKYPYLDVAMMQAL